MNDLLAEKQPQAFDRAWVRIKAPCVYRFFQREIRADNGGIDWDRVTRALDRKFQKQWTGSLRKKAKPYRDQSEVDTILQQYVDTLYTFISSQDQEDEHIRDIISIALVRIAQKGNIFAKQEIIKLLSFTIDAYSGEFRQAFRFISGTRSDLIRALCLTGERTPG
ncbi:MAG: hypothetical protein HGA43_04645 [Nitrospirae bacterium]|nr:hypothetical protein [Nitrospirota bacterium]